MRLLATNSQRMKGVGVFTEVPHGITFQPAACIHQVKTMTSTYSLHKKEGLSPDNLCTIV